MVKNDTVSQEAVLSLPLQQRIGLKHTEISNSFLNLITSFDSLFKHFSVTMLIKLRYSRDRKAIVGDSILPRSGIQAKIGFEKKDFDFFY